MYSKSHKSRMIHDKKENVQKRGKLLWQTAMDAGKCLLHWCNKLLHQAHHVYRSHSKASGSKAITKTSAISLKTQESHITK